MDNIKPGVYLDMPEDEYHSIKAFSKSLIKRCISPIDAWETLYGSGVKQTPDMLYGSAAHCLLLEGEESFMRRYGCEFDADNHPEALRTVDDLKNWLKSEGLPVTGNKPDLILRALDTDNPPEILDRLKVCWDAHNAGKELLKSDHYEEICERVHYGDLMPKGFSEVSLFWEDEKLGLPCKARLDRIARVDGRIEIWDLKTFTNTKGRDMETFPGHEIGSRRYHIDAYFYLRALRKTPGVKQAIGDLDHSTFHLLFVENGREIPNVIPCEIEIGGTELGQHAEAVTLNAARMVRDQDGRSGAKPWANVHPARAISEADVPPFYLY